MTDNRQWNAYIGRWQSPHKGHRWLIDRYLAKGEPVIIFIRPMPTSEKNPFSAAEVEAMLRSAFQDEIAADLVDTQILKRDIASVNYGRGVGYKVINHTEAAPEHIKRISATEIRKQIRAGEDGWRDMVMDGVDGYLEAKFK